MLKKMLHPAILILLGLAMHGVVRAADTPTDCRLKGGSVVQLPAAACALEGGVLVSAAVAPAAAAPASIGGAAADQPLASDTTSHSELSEAQNTILELLAKPVVEKTPTSKKPESIERTARFDGCRLMVDENLHIDYGNLYSAWKAFKISSKIDFQKIDRKEFGVLGKINSKGGDLSATALYFEESKRKDGNNISISVFDSGRGDYKKYNPYDLGAYWDAPRDDFGIADEYGYPKDSGWGAAATDKIRILLIVNSPDDAATLNNAFEEVNTMCKQQSKEPGSK